jgi:hypothetical protein
VLSVLGPFTQKGKKMILSDSTSRNPVTGSKVRKWMFTLCISLILSRQDGAAQSLNGTTGLVAIPTANMLNDREILFGGNYIDKKYNIRSPQNDQHRYFITMSFLPFLEVSIRYTRNHMLRLTDYPNEHPGDRGACIRVRVLKEKKYSPSLVLGAHDFLSSIAESKTIWFNALYLVGTKNVKPEKIPVEFGLNLGYGTDRMKAKHHEFVGLFGGISMEYRDLATLMLEYDAEKVNGGMRFVFFRHVQIMLALLNMNSFSGGASYVFSL